jgi:ubiquinone/menaquinone biosynthesis C-methylase UbiE
MKRQKILYNNTLGNEWAEWVEESNPAGSREQEIYPLVKKWFKKSKPAVLADIGCGQGICSSLLDKKIKYIGIDSSSVLIRRARKLYSTSNRKFMEGDVLKLPLKDGSVDAAMSIWVWSHIENIELAAKEMRRVLKSKGNFLIVTANPETYKERKTFYKSYKEKNGFLIGTFDLGDEKFLTDTTLYLHNKKRIKDAISRSGLIADFIKRVGQAETSDKGLYLAIQGHKR